MYAIAERFPIEARTYAASLEYHSGGEVPPGRGPRARVEGALMCPLGACFRAIWPEGWYIGTPDEIDVAESLYYPVHEDEWFIRGTWAADAEHRALVGEAEAFIQAWDTGQIANLADALGVA